MRPKTHSAKTILAPVRLFEKEGFNAGQLLAGTGLSLSILENPDTRIPLSQGLKFLRNIEKVTLNPESALRVGCAYPINLFGLYGYALMSAASLRKALQLAYKYVELSFAFLEHEFQVEGDTAIMSMSSVLYDDKELEMIAERELAATFMIVKGLLEKDDFLTGVKIAHAPRFSKSVYEKVFNCPVEFNCDAYQLQFPYDLLDLPLLHSDSDTAALCIEKCEISKARLDQQFTIVEEIEEHLLANPGRFPGVETMADMLNLSGRTLRRRLQDQGTRYQRIVDNIRFRLAKEYLETTSLTIEQIALSLDYSDTANFSNAFKRWAGESPQQYRMTISSGVNGVSA